MKTFLLSIFLVLVLVTLQAQGPVILQDGENIRIHAKLDTIVKWARDGNSIYLPGGNTVLPGTVYIDKELHIYGAGHYPDSSSATSITFITGGNICLKTGASGTSMTGFNIQTDILLNTQQTDTVGFISITRCAMKNLVLGYTSGQRNSNTSNVRVAENVIRGNINGADAQYCLFENNIINGQVTNLTGNCTFTNNIFSYYASTYDVFHNCTGVIVNNNIFTRDYPGLSSSQVNNNIFSQNIVGEPGGSNIGSGNIGNQSPLTLFVSFDGVNFKYSDDYHLVEGSAGAGAGTDGTDIGLYGGPNSYKASAVPVNPHISKAIIGRESVEGKVAVEIMVSAQDH